MIIFKILLVLLIAAPVLFAGGYLFMHAYDIASKQNKKEMRELKEKEQRSRYYR